MDKNRSEDNDLTIAATRMSRIYFGLIASVILFAACAAYASRRLVLSALLASLGVFVLFAAYFAPSKLISKAGRYLP